VQHDAPRCATTYPLGMTKTFSRRLKIASVYVGKKTARQFKISAPPPNFQLTHNAASFITMRKKSHGHPKIGETIGCAWQICLEAEAWKPYPDPLPCLSDKSTLTCTAIILLLPWEDK
jgi:hypothetical protein